MGPKLSPIRVDRACARRLAAVHVIIGQFVLSIGRSCHCWAVHVVILRALAHTWLSCRPPCCRITHPAVMSPTLLSCCHALLSYHPPCCRFTCPIVVWAIRVSVHLPCPRSALYPCCGVPPGHCCAVVVSRSSLHCCGHPGCTFVTILVSPLLLS